MTDKEILSIVAHIHLEWLPAQFPVKVKRLLNMLIDLGPNFQAMTYQKYAELEGWFPSLLQIKRHFHSLEGKIIYLPEDKSICSALQPSTENRAEEMDLSSRTWPLFLRAS